MKNKIEEDIKIIENFKNNKLQRDKLEKDSRCGGFKMGEIYKITELNPAIENILADREEWKIKAEWFKRCCNKNFDTAKQLQAKANKYDALLEKAKRLLDYAENYAEKGEFNNGYCQAINNVLKEEV